ncbi:MAG: hypothetical protein IJP31_05995 [Lachnospiraceae bacterium]|nr:hypothetical protein [Lachnospiraceae bacterium]
MRKAATKDILRTIWKEKKRFISIMLITTLGVTMMTGLSAGCKDLRYSADSFFDEQKLFDISILSTLGLTDADVQALAGLDGVEYAEGSYSEIVHTKKGDLNKTAEVKTIRQEGMNLPYLQEGSLPEAPDEIAVTANYMKDTGKRIGDKVVIEEMLDEEDAEEAEAKDIEESIAGEAQKNTDSKAESETQKSTDNEETDTEDKVEVKEDYLEEEKETPNFLSTEYTITGVVVDVMDINNSESAAAFRATPNADYTFFVLPEAIDSEVYTTVYLSLEGTKELLCYTTEYEERVSGLVSYIENEIKEQREQARYDEITGEAYKKIYDAEKEMNEAFADIEQEFADAEEEIADGFKEIEDGRQEIKDGWQELAKKEQEAAAEIADARAEIEDGYRKLEEGEQEIKAASDQLYQGNLQMAQGRAELEAKEAETKEQIAQGEKLLEAKQQENSQAKAALAEEVAGVSGMFGAAWPAGVWDAYVSAATQIAAQILGQQDMTSSGSMTGEQQAALFQAVSSQLAASQPGVADTFYQTFEAMAAYIPNQDAGSFVQQMNQLALCTALFNATEQILDQAVDTLAEQKAYAERQFAAGWAEIAKGEEELAAATAQIHDAKRELTENRQKLDDAVRELEENEEKARQEFADARIELRDGEQELRDGEQELLDGEKELAENRIEYEKEKGEAEDKIAEAKAEVEDIDMTQWYVQDRTSLSGYVNVESDTASIESLASVFTIVFFVVAILISLTTVTRMVEEERGLVGTYKALGFTDAEIRRKYVVYAFSASMAGGLLGDFCGFVVLPKILFLFFEVMYLLPQYHIQFIPSSGTVGVILFMAGIVGAAIWACEAELKHLPAQLMRPKAPRLGSKVLLEWITPLWKRFSFLNKVTARNLFRYKKRLLMTIMGIAGCTALVLFGFAIKDSVAELMPMQYEQVYKYDLLAAASSKDNDKLLAYVEDSTEVDSFINIQVETVKLKNSAGATEKVQIMIFPGGTDIAPYVKLTNVEGEVVSLPEEGIYLTENAVKTLRLEKGDSARMQNLDLEEREVQIRDVVKNYLGNNIYMSQEAYESAFGEYLPNGILANLSDECVDQIAFSDTLAMEDWILSSVSTQELKEGFATAFTLINIVVYVVLVLAAGLAFVVLFTLATTNISERIRELATIKVLGFFDREVHLYVNKETLILTGIGILLGLPVGALMSSALTTILDMPSIYFAVTIYPRSFAISAGVSLVFAFMVQFLTDRTLDAIDPVEALKSVE